MEKDFFSTAEVAKILGVSRITVFNKIKSGEIKAEKIGHSFVVPKKNVLEAAGTLLTKGQKRGINRAVERAAKQYERAFRLLGKE